MPVGVCVCERERAGDIFVVESPVCEMSKFGDNKYEKSFLNSYVLKSVQIMNILSLMLYTLLTFWHWNLTFKS
jgi:hypothetical protein